MSHTPFTSKLRRWFCLSSQLDRNSHQPRATRLQSNRLSKDDPNEKLELPSNRRDFIHGAATSLLLASPLMRSMAWAAAAADLALPMPGEAAVVVLGAGIAGLSAAYELTKLGIKPVIYEASGRVGGRMFTIPSFNADGMSVELGGEFVDTDHATIRALCQEFGIHLDAFIDEDKGLAQNIYYFKNRYYTDSDAIRAFGLIAQQLKSDIAKNDPAAEVFDKMSLKKYLAGFHGKTEDWFLELLRVGMLAEAGLDSDQLPAGYLLSVLGSTQSDGFSLYGASDQAYCIRGGTVALINALHDRLKSRGVEVKFSHRLIGIKNLSAKLALTLKNENANVEIQTQRCICTIPFTLLREVDGIKKLGLSPRKLSAIQRMTYSPAGKMIIGYKSRPWRKAITSGAIHVPASNGMVYSDLRSQNTWEASRTLKGASGILTNFVGAGEGMNLDQRAQPAMIAANEKVFPGISKELDSHSIFWNWHKFPLSYGAYSSTHMGDRSLFGSSASTPELSGRLHFAGEHTSENFGGFMEGGAETGIRAARACAAKK